MDNKYLKRSVILSAVFVLLVLISLSAVTFAWFSAANRQVNTVRVTSKTSGADIQLLLNDSADFSKGGTNALNLNETELHELMPVSTADLEHFVFNPSAEGNMATAFSPAPADLYYHKQFYMKAEVAEMDIAAVQVYLDGSSSGKTSGCPLVESSGADGLFLNAARVGLRFTEAGKSDGTAAIIRLSDAHNPQGSHMNTVLNGVDLGEGMVLKSDDAAQIISAVPDPSKSYQAFTIRDNGALPEQYLVALKPNVVYTVDAYFYLEGCDPDCTEIISADFADLSLWFYGMVA